MSPNVPTTPATPGLLRHLPGPRWRQREWNLKTNKQKNKTLQNSWFFGLFFFSCTLLRGFLVIHSNIYQIKTIVLVRLNLLSSCCFTSWVTWIFPNLFRYIFIENPWSYIVSWLISVTVYWIFLTNLIFSVIIVPCSLGIYHFKVLYSAQEPISTISAAKVFFFISSTKSSYKTQQKVIPFSSQVEKVLSLS